MLSDGKFEYLYKGNDRVPFAQIETDTDIVTYLHSDLTGSIVASTDSDGSLIGKVDYSPYGEPTDTALSRFGYAGEWVDETTGYSFLRARWLDVKTGSFLSEDPLVQMTQSAFDYTEGNPLTQIDPLGLFSWGGLYNGILDNSALISTGLMIAGAVVSATGVGAPVGLAIIALGSGLSAASAERNFRNGNNIDGTVDLVGIIPGAAIFKNVYKVRKADKILEKSYQSVLSSRKELKIRRVSIKSGRKSDRWDDFSNGVVGFWTRWSDQ